MEEEVLGEERVGGRHARAEGARVELLGGGEAVEEGDFLSLMASRLARPCLVLTREKIIG